MGICLECQRVAAQKVWEVGPIINSRRKRKGVRAKEEAVLTSKCLSSPPGETEVGSHPHPWLRKSTVLQIPRGCGTCSRSGRGSSGAAARTTCAHRPLPSPSSGAAEMDSISWGGGCSGPSSGSASATGHLTPGSFHLCRGEKKRVGGKSGMRKLGMLDLSEDI